MRSRGQLPLVLIGIFLVILAVSTAMTSTQVTRVTPPQIVWGPANGAPIDIPDIPSLPDPPDAGSESGISLGPWFDTIVTVLGGVLALGVAGALLWYTLRDRLNFQLRTPQSPIRTAQRRREEVRAAVVAGIDDLDDPTIDARRAVIACWLRLERAAAEAGTPRAPSDTPGDLVSRMLTEQRISAELLARLADVYRWARYAPHDVDERMRVEARRALEQLAAELAAPARSEVTT